MTIVIGYISLIDSYLTIHVIGNSHVMRTIYLFSKAFSYDLTRGTTSSLHKTRCLECVPHNWFPLEWHKPGSGCCAHSSPTVLWHHFCTSSSLFIDFKPLSTLLRISTHPIRLKVHVSFLIKRNDQRQKIGVNIK